MYICFLEGYWRIGKGFGGVSASKSLPTGTDSSIEDMVMSWGPIGDILRAAVVGLRLKDPGGLLNGVMLMEGLLLANRSLALADLSGLLGALLSDLSGLLGALLADLSGLLGALWCSGE